MRGRWIIAAVLAGLLAPATVRAQLVADYANSVRLTASDTHVLATWTDGAAIFNARLAPDGRVAGRVKRVATRETDDFALRELRTAWNPMTRRFAMAWVAPDGLKLRSLRADGTAFGAARMLFANGPDRAVQLTDLAVHPETGRGLVAALVRGTGGLARIRRLGVPDVPIPGPGAALAPRPGGGWLAVDGALRVRVLRPDGRGAGPLRPLTGTPTPRTEVRLAVHPRSGRGLAAWVDARGGVTARPVSAEGRPVGTPFELPATATWGQQISLLPRGPDRFLLAYQREIAGVNEIVLRSLNRNGRPVAPPRIVNPGSGDPWPSGPALASLRGHVLLGYAHQRDAASERVVAGPVAP